MTKDIRQQYDDFADRYDEVFLTRQRDKILKLAAYIPRPWSRPSLDAGAGTGIAGRVLSHPFIHVDLSHAMLRHAPIPGVVANLEQLPFRNDTFGFILSVSVIDHRVDTRLAIGQLFRVLKPGGYLGISILKSEDVAGAAWSLESTFHSIERRIDLGPDIGFVVKKP